jgi:nitroreductase
MDYTKPITDLIRQRFSARSYLARPIEGETRQRLADFVASSPPSPFGSHPRFALVVATEQDRQALKGLGTYGFIRGATGFIIGAVQDVNGNPGASAKNLEDFGYQMERIVLCATDLGLGTCWLGGSFTKSSFSAKISATSGELVPAVASVGYIAERPGVVDRVIRRGAGSDKRLPWEQIFFEGDFSTPLTQERAGAYSLPLEMVRLGPSASNKQPWRFVKEGTAWNLYLQRTPGYAAGRFTRRWVSADMQRIDMGIAMSHFALTAQEQGLGGCWKIGEPGLEVPDGLTEYVVSWVAS